MKPRKSVTEGSAGSAARISSFAARRATGNRGLRVAITILAQRRGFVWNGGPGHVSMVGQVPTTKVEYSERCRSSAERRIMAFTALRGAGLKENNRARSFSAAARGGREMSEKIYDVPPEWKKRAYIDADKYKEMYARSLKDPNGFWAEEAKRLHWYKAPTKIKNSSFGPGNVSIKWFEDGVLNAAYNCIDRHLPN